MKIQKIKHMSGMNLKFNKPIIINGKKMKDKESETEESFDTLFNAELEKLNGKRY